MAFAFLPSHPIHTKVATHAANVAQAHTNARAYTQSAYYMHDATHSIQDLSNVPYHPHPTMGPAGFVAEQGRLPNSTLLGTGYAGTSILPQGGGTSQTSAYGDENSPTFDPHPGNIWSFPGRTIVKAGNQIQ